jgi:hypothetical protein
MANRAATVGVPFAHMIDILEGDDVAAVSDVLRDLLGETVRDAGRTATTSLPSSRSAGEWRSPGPEDRYMSW